MKDGSLLPTSPRKMLVFPSFFEKLDAKFEGHCGLEISRRPHIPKGTFGQGLVR
jgi:hypothetical protein